MAFLRAFGTSLPERIVTNEELAPALGVEPEWIFTQSGIRERRYACETDTVATLGAAAARDCLATAELKPEELGLILVASGSPRSLLPRSGELHRGAARAERDARPRSSHRQRRLARCPVACLTARCRSRQHPRPWRGDHVPPHRSDA